MATSVVAACNHEQNGRMKTGTSCNRCKYASDCPAYDPRSAYGFCQGFEPEASRSGPVSENTQNATCNEKTNQPDHAYTPVVKNANEGA